MVAREAVRAVGAMAVETEDERAAFPARAARAARVTRAVGSIHHNHCTDAIRI
jgi:hypothetical protein